MKGPSSNQLSIFRVLDKTRVLASVDASIGNLTASIGLLVTATTPKTTCPSIGTRRRRSLVEGLAGGPCLLDDERWKPILPEAIRVVTQFKDAVSDWRHRLAAASQGKSDDLFSC